MDCGINKLIVELRKTGHHPVYLKYIINHLISNNNDSTQYYLLLNEFYKDLSLDFSSISNVNFIFIKQSKIDELYSGNLLFNSFKLTKFVEEFCLNLKIDDVLLMDMNIYQFGLIFSKSVKYRGIIFSQYFRQDISKSFSEKIRFFKRSMLIRILIKKNNIKCIYFLNDDKGVRLENTKLKTTKLKSINDPVEPIDYSNIIDINKIYNISRTDKIFLHYGSFDKRKGSELILESFLEIDKKLFNGITLIYAGKTNDEILQTSLNKKMNQLIEKGLNIIFINQYIDKCTTDSLFVACHYVLCPYSSIEASSGNVGLAIASDTSIIGPKNGLLGSIINSTGLGIQIESINKESLKTVLLDLLNKPLSKKISKINIETRSPINFAEELLS